MVDLCDEPGLCVNDRAFYGNYRHAKVWASNRFPFVTSYVKRHEQEPLRLANGHFNTKTGIHSETFLQELLNYYKVPYQAKQMCFFRLRATGVILDEDCDIPGAKMSTKYAEYNQLVGFNRNILRDFNCTDGASTGKLKSHPCVPIKKLKRNNWATRTTNSTTDKFNFFWMVVSWKKKLAVNVVPKVMCTSIRLAINTMECADSQDLRCAEARREERLQDLSQYQNLTKVVIFRDPFERLYSAYLNSDVNPYIYLQECADAAQCTFEEWVDEMYADPQLSFANEHFKPQRDIAQMEKLHYDYMLRLSSRRDMDLFWRLVGKNSTKENSSKSLKNGANIIDTFKNFPRKTLDKIATIYKGDLQLWADLLKNDTSIDDDQELSVYDYYNKISTGE